SYSRNSDTSSYVSGSNSLLGKLTVNGQYLSTQHSSSVQVNWNSGNVQNIRLVSGNNGITASNPVAGGRYLLLLKQPSAGAAGTVTWSGSLWLWSGGSAPTLTATNNKIDVIGFV